MVLQQIWKENNFNLFDKKGNRVTYSLFCFISPSEKHSLLSVYFLRDSLRVILLKIKSNIMKTILNQFKKLAALTAIVISAQSCYSQTGTPAFVDYDAFEKLVSEVKAHRKTHLLTTQEFKNTSSQEKVIVLDTRSDSAYAAVHIKGAVHLNFSDFTQDNLAKIIPSPDYKILIYCNNNFNITTINPNKVDPKIFEMAMATKSVRPEILTSSLVIKPLTLALNIPTYINLYGYGYKNVYELSELVNTNDNIIEFEGTAVKK